MLATHVGRYGSSRGSLPRVHPMDMWSIDYDYALLISGLAVLHRETCYQYLDRYLLDGAHDDVTHHNT